jgi:hypothetical protein
MLLAYRRLHIIRKCTGGLARPSGHIRAGAAGKAVSRGVVVLVAKPVAQAIQASLKHGRRD